MIDQIIEPDFQRRVLAFLYQNADRFATAIPLLRDECFPVEPARSTYSLLKLWFGKTGKLPAPAEMVSAMKKSGWKNEAPTVLVAWEKWLRTLWEEPVTPLTWEELAAFLARQLILNMSTRMHDTTAVDLVRQCQEIVNGVGPFLSAAAPASRNSIFDPNYIRERNREILSPETRRPFIPLGIPKFDEAMGGGLPREEMALLLGTSGSGKSFLVMWIAVNMLEMGYSGLFISIDNPKNMCEDRFYRRASRMPKFAAHELGRQAEREIDPRVKRRLHEEYLERRAYAMLEWTDRYKIRPDQFVVDSSMSPENNTVAEVAAVIKRVNDENGERDFVCLDYQDQLLPTVPDPTLWIAQRKVSMELKAVVKDFGVAFVSPTQGDTAGMAVSEEDREKYGETKVLKGRNVGESRAKIKPAAVGISLNRTEVERNMTPQRARLYLFKNRYGQDAISVPYLTDLDSCWFEEDSEYLPPAQRQLVEGKETRALVSFTAPTEVVVPATNGEAYVSRKPDRAKFRRRDMSEMVYDGVNPEGGLS